MVSYDEPLDYVFCVVMGAADEPLHSNLHDDGAGCEQQDVEYYRPILTHMDQGPGSMFMEVASDQRNQVGNVVLQHNFSKKKTIEMEGKRLFRE